MKKLTALLVGALALATTLSSAAHAAPNAQEEQFALEGAAMLMLAVDNLKTCDIGAGVPALMDMVGRAYEASGVKVEDYPKGEWSRKIFFFIARNSFYSAVLNHNPASVASFYKFLHEKVLPKIKESK